VGTGGYASGIPLAWARAHDARIVQHIGDAFPGAAARVFARWSEECYLGFPEAMQHLPQGRARYLVTGNPIEPPPDPRPDRAELMTKWRLPKGSRVLLVFGGSQGSRAINQVVAAWTRDRIPDGWSVLWATGTTLYGDYQGEDRARVRVVPYLSPIADAYGVATLALVRGGMMGTTELCAWGIPMIIVPLPTAAADHQSWNARSLDAAGAAIHLPQRDMSVDRLDELIRTLSTDESRLAALTAGALHRARPNAAAEIARQISALL
jgi:UDP-N-acetylglucosamine--N-acetylmuramyl-(pentapeptide) pyrophosphoryl-undecaprenol N-acetylglucosamine transferase